MAAERGVEALGVSEHIHRFQQALEVWQHPFWRERGARRPRRVLRVRAQRDRRWRSASRPTSCRAARTRWRHLLEARDWDYVIGSIHFLRDEAIDMRGDWDIWRSGDPDKVWRRYFETLGEAARSGMFDILAHPDLVKVWGSAAPVPDRDPRFYYELAMEGIADSDVAIEVSTAGLRKPVGEIYPAPRVPRDVPGGRPAGGAVLRRAHARRPRLPLRGRARVPRASWA